jgi:peptidoglycan/LPS O-acetylase OafA/YrhL
MIKYEGQNLVNVSSNLRWIDSLRGIAILAVIMVHCGQFGDMGGVASLKA